MMKELVCIVCPNGCNLQITDEKGKITVTGNECKRGEKFAVSELTAPARSLTTCVRTSFADFPMLPVRTDGDIPKDRLFEAMGLLNKVTVDKKLHCGDIVLPHIFGSEINVIATTDIK